MVDISGCLFDDVVAMLHVLVAVFNDAGTIAVAVPPTAHLVLTKIRAEQTANLL